MSKRDNVGLVLMTHCKVNLDCDGQKLQCRYGKSSPNAEINTWHVNGKDTGLQVTAFIKDLKEKYISIRVIWKRQF